MSNDERSGRTDLGVRIAGMYFPTVVTAHLLVVWLSKPLAWVISILVWNLAVYWIPPRPRLRFRRWLIIVSLLAVTGFILATFAPDMM